MLLEENGAFLAVLFELGGLSQPIEPLVERLFA